jgi:hypothetical protein
MIKILPVLLLFCFSIVSRCIAADYPTPNPTYDAAQFTQWNPASVKNSKKANIYVPFVASDGSNDMISIYRLDLVGNDYERGYAHGFLMARGNHWLELLFRYFSSNVHLFYAHIVEILEFQGPQLDKFFIQEVMGIDLSGFPEPLQKILRVIQIEGAIAAPAAFRAALAWVWDTQKKYAPSFITEEMSGMGVGMCDALNTPNCNSTKFSEDIAHTNMLPELIRMKCTAYGAWGKATAGADSALIQLRALDFGGGPFANYTIAAVYRDATVTEDSNAFVSITFPGFAGAITGMSQRGIGLSQKVWTTYDGRGYLPGSFEGETDVFVLRNILQNTHTRLVFDTHSRIPCRICSTLLVISCNQHCVSPPPIGARQKHTCSK